MASRKRVRAEAKRVEILKAATTLFLAHGYDGVSVDAIIAVAGGTKTNVYKLFGDKAALFAAVVEDLGHQTAQSVSALATLGIDPQKPEEALRKLGREYLDLVLTKRALRAHRLVIAEAERAPAVARKWAKTVSESAREAFSSHIGELQKGSGFLRLPAVRLAGLFLDLLSDGLLFRLLSAATKPLSDRELKAHLDDAVAVFLSGATAR